MSQIPLALALCWCCVGEGQVRALVSIIQRFLQPHCLVRFFFFGEVKEPACIVLIFISQVSVHRLLPQPLSSPLICVGVSARRLEESVKSTGLELQMVVNCRVDPGS